MWVEGGKSSCVFIFSLDRSWCFLSICLHCVFCFYFIFLWVMVCSFNICLYYSFLCSFCLPLGHGVFFQYFFIGLSIYTWSPHLFLRQGQEDDKTGTIQKMKNPRGSIIFSSWIKKFTKKGGRNKKMKKQWWILEKSSFFLHFWYSCCPSFCLHLFLHVLIICLSLHRLCLHLFLVAICYLHVAFCL